MRMRGGVRRFQVGGVNPAVMQQNRLRSAGAPPAVGGAPAAVAAPGMNPGQPDPRQSMAALQQMWQQRGGPPPTPVPMGGAAPGGPMPPGGGMSPQQQQGGFNPQSMISPQQNVAINGGMPTGGGAPPQMPQMPQRPGMGGGAQQGAFTAGAPGAGLGSAPGLNPQAIQQALQMRGSMAGGPPAPGGPAGAPASGWPGMPQGGPMMPQRPGMPQGGAAPPQGMPPQQFWPGVGMGAGMGPGGPPPQGLGAMAGGGFQNPQATPQQLAAIQAQNAQLLQANPGLRGAGMGFAEGGAVEDGDTDAKKSRPDRQWGKRVAAEDIPEAPAKKAKGGPIKRRRPPAVKVAKPKAPAPMTPGGMSDDDADVPPPPVAAPPAIGGAPVGAMPGMKKGGAVEHGANCDCADCAGKMAKGGKWIAGAIKHPGALHKQLGVPQGEKIPAKKLAKAADAGGKLGQRARLAQTLKGFKKAKGGACDEKKMAKGGFSKFNPTKAAPGNLATHPGKKFAAGGAAKVRHGFPNVNKAPQRLAKGGKVRGSGAATKGFRFSGVY